MKITAVTPWLVRAGTRGWGGYLFVGMNMGYLRENVIDVG